MSVVNIDTSSVSTSAKYAVGQIFRDDAVGKTYKYVLYNDGTANHDLVAGDVLVYVDDSGYGASTVTADVSDISGKEIGAGVAVAAVTVDASYFWIQIKGAATCAVNIGGTLSDGDCLTAVGAADKALTLAAEADSTADYVHVCALAVDDTADEIICLFPE